MKKTIGCYGLLSLLISNLAYAAIPASFCCDHASKRSLCIQSNQILQNLNKLSNQVSACCSTLENDITNLNPCGGIRVIGQADIPAVINQPGFVCLKQDIYFDGTTVTNPGIEGPIAIAINANNVVLDLNNHTITYKGTGANGIATIGTSAHITIKNGTIVGSPDPFTSGVLVNTSDVTVENMRIINASGPFSSGIVLMGAFIPNVAVTQLILAPQTAIVVANCDLENNFFGIQLQTLSNMVVIKDCMINRSIQMGITQPSRKNTAENIIIDRCTIANSGLNGIYTTFSQTNWTISNCKVSKTGLNGMILEAFQNLRVSNCQVIESGAHAIIASIRQSQNVVISDCELFNSQDSTLRVDNVASLAISNCQMTNYLATSAPLLKIQDVYNGFISGCLLTSGAGTSDGLLLRNCHNLTVDKCNAQILCNQPFAACPIGFNMQGDVEATVFRNCTVSGNPSIGIAFQQGNLNGPNTGVIVENCTVKGAVNQGIALASAINCGIYGCQVIGCQSDGIILGSQPPMAATTALQNSLRDNTLINNGGFGINNLAGDSNKIYRNFAQANGGSYNNVLFVTAPAAATPISNIDN